MAHTKGPWRPFAWGTKVGVTGDLNTADIALVSGFDTNRSIEEEMANAALIAAAPDMLAALTSVLLFVKPTPTNAAALNAAHVALAKAEGRS
ncbi:hypothetical protein [Sinorhizobium meliloti]|uniref:hypothetical protein n=1 Tax=Rhizobium meliloti TaxID=382 RepID=UPI000FDB41AF|nr:hypothetical protein [Sinorhizobium meliloti]RVN04633.1 hypothetical protein CN112_24905 [Sinorhizobium meliloti]